MKHLLLITSTLFLLAGCGGTDKFRIEHGKGPSRGEGFEEIVLLETDEGLDTLSYISLPFSAGNAVIRLHDELNIGVTAQSSGLDRHGWGGASLRYIELKDEEVAKQVTFDASDKRYIISNYQTLQIGRSQSFSLFLDGHDYWTRATAREKDNIAFLREMMGEQIDAVYDNAFLVRDIYSTKEKSTIVTYRLKTE